MARGELTRDIFHRAVISQRPPLGRLADGTPYFTPLGQLRYDRNIDRVQCHLCGDWFLALAPGQLLLAHRWNHEEDKSAFGLSKSRPLQIPRLLKRRRLVMLRLLRTNQAVRQALEDAQGKMRSGALLEPARAALHRPLPLDQRQRSIEAAARATTLWQRQSDQERAKRIRILGFRSVSSYPTQAVCLGGDGLWTPSRTSLPPDNQPSGD
jgi:hypothetical protein